MSEAVPPGGTLALEVHPDDLRRLRRHPALRAAPVQQGRATPVALTWHDTEAGALAEAGLLLVEAASGWRLERLCGAVVAAAPDFDGLRTDRGSDTALAGLAPHPIARFAGRERRIALGAVTLILRSGAIRVGAAEHPRHRLTLAGPPAAVAALAGRLATDLRVQAPLESLGAAAIRLAGVTPPAPPLGAPEIMPGSTVGEAFGHLVAQLTRTMRHWCARIGQDASTEPVHQARVAIRRLRSALALFRSAVAGPDIEPIEQSLRALAARLGTARDWDVFLAETAAPVQAAFAGDRRLARLASLAAARRDIAYAALAAWLQTPEFRVLGISLAALPAVVAETADPGLLAEDVAGFAARVLTRRRHKLLKAGKHIADLPAEALHRLRKRGKKFRYGCEFFAPLYPRSAKRLLRRLAKLQESLGHLNDGATAAMLLAELGGGRARSFASGAVHGFTVARGGEHRALIQRSWARFRREDAFWER